LRKQELKKLSKKDRKEKKKSFQSNKAQALVAQDLQESLKHRIARSTQTPDDFFLEALKKFVPEVTEKNWARLLVGIFVAMELEHSEVSGLVGEISYAVRHIINLMALRANKYDFLTQKSLFVVY